MTMLWSESISRFYKLEVIHRRGPRRRLEAIGFATLESGYIPLAEAEQG
ncbi:hypothetical protein IVB48_05630 [Bradyrhizobium sp. 76]|nr:hypothetical protein [Bradyrhizobium sp. 76]